MAIAIVKVVQCTIVHAVTGADFYRSMLRKSHLKCKLITVHKAVSGPSSGL